MLEKNHTPSLAQVCVIIDALISGSIDRHSVASWAGYWVSLPNPPIEDKKIWQAVRELSGADIKTTDRPFLYGDEDFKNWLNKLLSPI